MADGTVEGEVHRIGETKSYGAKGFLKRECVIAQEDGRWTNYIPLDFVQEGCALMDDVKLGDTIKVSFWLKGREWQKDAESEVKTFLNAQVDQMKVLERAPERTSERSYGEEPQTTPAAPGDDDVPF